MQRHINLRQIEAFKAVIENGTVSRASEVLNISQPALSKLIAHLEFDASLRLFDRVKGRLAPTEHGMRLYDEVVRIFSGVREVENAVDAIRREEQGRLAIGVIPALANTFIQGITTGFLQKRGNVFCSVQALGSQWIVEWLISRKLDIGLVSARVDNPYLTLEPFLEHPLVCIMPLGHPLAEKTYIEPNDLDKAPFIAFPSDIYIAHLVTTMLERYRVAPQIVLVSNAAPTICEFVASGLGVSLVHPLMVSGLEHDLVVRPFHPDIFYHFQICRNTDNRNAHIVEEFVQHMRERASEMSNTLVTTNADTAPAEPQASKKRRTGRLLRKDAQG